MKKILALLLAITMVVCMFAGCSKTEEKPDDTKAPTTSVEDNKDDTKPSEDPTEPSKPEEDPEDKPDAEPEKIDGRQEHWESVFSKGEHKAAFESFKLNTSGIMDTTCLTDGSKAYVEVAGKDDSGNEIAVGLLIVDENSIYFYQHGKEDGKEITNWYKCINIQESEDSDEDITESAGNDDDFDAALDAATKIEYVETVGDMDRVIVYYTVATDDTDDGYATSYDSTIEVEYNGVKGTYRYTEKTNGSGTISSHYSTNSIDGFTFGDWEFDKEKLTLTKGEEVIQCTLVTDHTKEEPAEAKIEVEINFKTSEIHKMVLTDAVGVESTIEYIDCKDVTETVKVPENAADIEYEDAVMQFVFTIFGIAMSGAAGN